MPKYYISADGGGTKLHSVLFDDSLNLISKSKSGAVNPNFTEAETIESNMRDGIVQCLTGTGVDHIERLFITMPGPHKMYENILRQYCTLDGCSIFSEGYAGITSGLFERRGIVALSGTGSGMFYMDGNRTACSLGGWGALFGDEGSGYEIGTAGIRAAQFAYDGRGKETLLVQMIISKFGLRNLHDIVGYTYRRKDYRSVISSVCLCVCDAAAQGDGAAIEIMKAAGRAQGLMFNTLVRKNNLSCSIPAVVSGSVWKYNPYMFDEFCDYVRAENPGFVIKKPYFEPVISGVVETAFDLYGSIDNNISKKLFGEFSDYIYEK